MGSLDGKKYDGNKDGVVVGGELGSVVGRLDGDVEGWLVG